MERINVSDAFRLEQTNCNFKMEFNAKVDMRKAYKAMEAAVMSVVNENGYYALWLQDLADCCVSDKFDIKSTLSCDEFMKYVPAMCKAVAEALPSTSFEVSATFDALNCYDVIEFEVAFADNSIARLILQIFVSLPTRLILSFGFNDLIERIMVFSK